MEQIREYTFAHGKDSPGNNIMDVPILRNDIPKLKVKCDSIPTCKGFNTNGSMKSKIIPQELWIDTSLPISLDTPSEPYGTTEGLYYVGSPTTYDFQKNITPPYEQTQILTRPIPTGNNVSVNNDARKTLYDKTIHIPWKKIIIGISSFVCLFITIIVIFKLLGYVVAKIV